MTQAFSTPIQSIQMAIGLRAKKNCQTFLALLLLALPGWVMGQNNSLHFNGGYVDLSGLTLPAGINQPMTVEFWFNRTTNDGDDDGFCGTTHAGTDRFSIYHATNANIFFHYGNLGASIPYSRVTDLNTWHHLAFVFDPANDIRKVYKDGVEVFNSNVAFDGPINPIVAPRLGTTIGWDRRLKGNMEDIRIWTSARTAAEINANKDREIFGGQCPLMAYYKCNQGVAGGNNAGLTTLTDNSSTGGNNDGTLVSFALNGAVGNWLSGYGSLGAPGGTCLSNVTTGTDAGNCSAVVNFTPPAAFNCNPWVWNYSPASGSVFNKGVTTVTANANDGNGNTFSCNFTVTVVDNQPPSITCAANVTQNAAAGLCTAAVTVTGPTGTDNCLGVNNALAMTGGMVATASYPGTNYLGDMTFEAWFNGTSLNGATLISRDYTAEFDLTFWGNSLKYYHNNGVGYEDINLSYVFTPNTWYHVAVVRDVTAHNLTIFVNGVQQNVVGYGPNPPSASNIPLYIGSRGGGTNFTGKIDEVRVWNVKRTPAQIAYNYTLQMAGNEANLQAYYRLNEGVAGANNPGVTLAHDQTANLRHATLTGFALNGLTSNWVAGAPAQFGGGYMFTNSFNGTNNANGTYPVGTTAVTWTATDDAGNTATCAQTVTVTDNQNPVVTCPASFSVNAAAGLCTAVATYAATATDNCGIQGIVYSPASGSTFNFGANTVTVTATDVNSLTATCSFTVTVNDNQVPTITCPSNIVVNAAAGVCTQVVTFAATATDNCGTATISYSPASGSTFNFGATTVTAAANDGNGNTTTCSFTVTVNDIQVPVITCPSNIVVNAAAGVCNAVATFAATATDNCGTATISYSPASGSTFSFGTTTVTATASDGNGNTATCSFTVTVNDTQVPVITCPSNIVVNAAAGVCTQVVTFAATASDNCGTATISYSPASGSTFNFGATTVTATANDGNGNTATCSFTVTVVDNQPPTITCAANVAQNAAAGLCNANVTVATPTVVDNCGGGNGLDFDGVNDYAFSPMSGNGLTQLTIEFWFKKNNANFTGMFQWADQLTHNVPWIALKDSGTDMTLYANGNNRITSTGLTTGTWYHIAVTYNANLWSMYINGTLVGTSATGIGAYLRTGVYFGNAFPNYWNGAVDEARIWNFARTQAQIAATMNQALTGNESGLLAYYPFNQGVANGNNVGLTNVLDLAPANGNNNLTLNNLALNGANSNWVNGIATIGLVNSFTGTGNASGTYPVGTTVVTWTATDGAGNTSTCTQTVTVTDNQNPVVTCPASFSVNAGAGLCTATATYAATATDNCGIQSIAYNPVSGSTFNFGANTVTVTATDVNGNSSTCSFTVTVNDNQAPSITCPSNIVVNAAAGVCNTVVTFAATASDNCGTANISYSPASGSTFNLGATTVTATANDGNGNTSTCSFTVTVNDNQVPVITCPANISVNAAAGQCSANVTFAATATDNCGTATLTYSPASGTSFNVGATTVTATANDGNGNTATCSFTVTVVDNQAPAITCASNVTINATAGLCTGTTILTPPTATDNCNALGNALDFDGNNDQIIVPDNPAFDPAIFTIECWAKPRVANGNYGTPFAKRTPSSGYTLYWHNGFWEFWHGWNNMVQFAGTAGVWQHVAVEYDGTTYRLFLNGVQVGTAVGGYTPGSGGNPFGIGIQTQGSTFFFDGALDEVHVWNVARSQAQIQANKNTSLGAQAGLVAVYNMNQGIAGGNNAGLVTALDASGNNRNGTLSNFNLNGATSNWVNGNIAVDLANNAPGTYPVGPTTVTWTATDAAGNTATCTQTVMVVDNQNPVVTCPASFSVNAAAGLCTATATYAATATDNCGIQTTVYNPVSGSTFNFGANTVTVTTADVNGNSSTCSFTVTVNDNQVPTITCPANIVVNADAGVCNAVVTFAATASDNCGTTTISYSPASGSTFNFGTTTVTATANDGHGNTSTCSFTVTVNDNQVPTITCPANIVVNAAAGLCTAVVTYAATGSDNCGTATLSYSPASGSTFAFGTTTVTATANDGNGNTSTCSFTVTVNDNQVPTITCPASFSVNAAAGICTQVVTFAATATDNCGTATLSYSPTSGSTFAFGTTTVIATANDGNGNTSTCSFSLTVNDNQVPVVTCPSNITVNAAAGQCSANVTFAATATDNCGTATLAYSAASGSSFDVGTTTVTATANDGHGNTSTCTFTVTVTDNQAPTIACAANATANAAAGLCNASVTVTSPTASDNCSVFNNALAKNGGAVATANYLGTNYLGDMTMEAWFNGATLDGKTLMARDYTAEFDLTFWSNQLKYYHQDGGGYVDFSLQYVFAPNTWYHVAVVRDATVRTVTLFVNGVQQGTFGYAGNPTIAQNMPFYIGGRPGGQSFNGKIDDVRLWNVKRTPAQILGNYNTQLVGNEANLLAYYKLNEGVAGGNNAGVTLANDQTANHRHATLTGFALTGQTSNWVAGAPALTGGLTLANSFNGTNNASGTYPVGTTTVNWTATDVAGNTATCSQTVTVTDNQNPVLTCPTSFSVNAAAGLCSAVVTYAATSTDNCGIQSTVYNPVSGSTFNFGVNTVTVSTTDVNGNSSTCSFTVTVNDNQAPSIACPSNIVVNAGAGICTQVVTFAATASDNCGTATISYNPASGSTFNYGNTTVTATANDGHGNTSTCSFIVTVNDTQVPTITCPSNIVVNAAAGVCTQVVTFASTATDNCGTATISYSPASGSIFNFGNTTVTATANDGHGNTSTCSFTVTVNDNQAPIAICQNISAQLDVNGQASITAAQLDNGSNDNCGNVTLGIGGGQTNFTCSDNGQTFTVTLVVTDASGNTATCNAQVTVADDIFPCNQAPIAVCQNVMANADGNCQANVAAAQFDGGSTDPEFDPLTFTASPAGPYNLGVTNVVLTVNDGHGGTATCNATVTVVDNIAPTITCPGNITHNNDPGQCSAVVTFAATASDNCSATVSYSPASGSVFNHGTTTVTATATDLSGNTASCSFTVTVVDNQAPAITCPANLHVNNLPGQCEAVATFSATATDNCGMQGITYSPASGSTFNMGTTMVTATATDQSGNTSVCTFTVTVHDVQPPVVTCPGQQSLSGVASVTLPNYLPLVTATDCSGPVTFVQSPVVGSVYPNPQDNVTVTITATDAFNNSSTCTFLVDFCWPQVAVIYVDDNAVGLNNGDSWGNAFNNLQTAMAAVTPGGQIWVKEGTYKPTNTNDRTQRFELLAGMHLYGGFPQNADCYTSFNDRDPALYESILSGNIGNQGLATDNSYCIVRTFNVGTDVVLDGFVVSDAYTTINTRPAAVAISASGAGLESSPHFASCVFRNNINPFYGGALYTRAFEGSTAAPTFDNCTFMNNAGTNYGGAAYLTAKSTAYLNPTFNNCIFTGNTVSASGHGGGVATYVEAYCTSLVTFNGCTFNGHSVLGNGGGVWVSALKSTSSTVFNNTTFNGNSADNGGGVYQKGATSEMTLSMTGCTFDGNTASVDGGGLHVYGDKTNIDNTTVQQTMFRNNNASRGGGAFLYNLGGGCFGTGYFENCVFYNNGSTTYGGGLGVYARSLGSYNTTLQSCSFHSNDAATFGGAVSNYITNAGSISVLNLQNTLVWGNPAATGKAFYTFNVGATTNFNDGLLDFATCASNNSGTGAFSCAGLVAGDPLFVNGGAGDLHLQAGSPAIDAGGPGVLTDFDGFSRPVGGGFDIGAFEYGGVLPRLAPEEENNSQFTIHNSQLKMSLFPNPTTDRFTAQFDQEVTGRVEVMDLQGRVIFSDNIIGTDRMELSISGHPSGTYFVRMITDSEIIVKTIIVHRP